MEALFALLEFFGVAYLAYELVNGLNYCFSHRGNFRFVFRPAWIVLFVPPCMACLSIVLLFHDRVKEYVFRTLLARAVPDAWTSPALSGPLRKTAIAWALVFGAISFALVPIHTRITETGIGMYPIWPLAGRTHPYSEVSCIALEYHYNPPSSHSRGGWSRERALYVRFRDGRTWATMNGLAEVNAAERSEAADYISARTGVGIKMPALGAPASCSAP